MLVLVCSVPAADLVLYGDFQVEASMNQVAGNQMRLYDLPSKLLCRVLNVELKVPPLPAAFPPNFAANSVPCARLFSMWGAISVGVLTCSPNFNRRRRRPTRSTRRSCSCQSPR